MVRFGVFAVCLAACGSPESNALTQSRSGATGGTTVQAVGGAAGAGGAPTFGGGGVNYGGDPYAAGGIPSGAGGVPAAGGFVSYPAGGAGAGPSAGGSSAGGTAPDSGVPPWSGGSGAAAGGASAGSGGDTGSTVNPFPPGGLITQACSDCARTKCRTQEDACAAEPACVAIGTCLSTCFGPTCLTCIPSLTNQAGYAKFTDVSNCTDSLCQPMCPLLNSGGGTNP